MNAPEGIEEATIEEEMMTVDTEVTIWPKAMILTLLGVHQATIEEEAEICPINRIEDHQEMIVISHATMIDTAIMNPEVLEETGKYFLQNRKF